MRVARAGDLPKQSRSFFLGGMGGFMPMIAPMPPMPPMPAMPRMRDWPRDGAMHFEFGPEIEDALHEAGMQLERIQPELDHLLRNLPQALEAIELPTIRVDIDTDRPAKAATKAKPAAAPRVQTVSM
jgi:hypothetical protein